MLLLLSCAEPGPATLSRELEGSLDSGFVETRLADTGEPRDWLAEAEAPFVKSPDSAEGLVNTSADLDELLEGLDGACEAWRADRSDREKELRCGKSMFFYETFGTAGVPTALTDFMLHGFPDQVGPGFSELGLIQDPTSAKGYPLGLSDQGNGVAFTCASCHFGQLPDGRYSVGAPNHSYEYGRHNLVLAVTLLSAMSGLTGAEIHPDAQAVVQPLLDELAGDIGLQWQLVGVLISLLGQEVPSFSVENQGFYANWKSGTMDFLIEPLPVDDGVHTVSKISALWDIPTDEEATSAGMRDAMLGHTGNTGSTMEFVALFGVVGGEGEPWSEAELAPLVHYLESLEAPEPREAPAEEGARVFVEAGCLECHSGPAGSGLGLYEFEEIGTDDAIAAWMDPDLDGAACCGFEDEVPITNAVKSPRLVGLWAMDRFLHNGSVDSLEQLLCLEPRPERRSPESSSGHRYGCELSEVDRRALVEFLEAH